jgi:hypothetical protein
MRRICIGLLLVSISLLGGCAKYWYQEGKSFKETRRALDACRVEASRYADVNRTLGLGSYTEKFVKECMRKNGYELVREKNLPIRVKRESSPVFGMAGIAGTID